MSTNTKISNLVHSQVPDFVKKDGPAFVDFMEAYFEFLEQSNPILSQGNVIERSSNFLDNLDIDRTLDDFADRFYNEFLHFLPKNVLADKKILVKNIQDFYRAKGTEKALKFLMRIISGTEASVYYPKIDILRASDGKWFVQKSLRVTGVAIDNSITTLQSDMDNFSNHKITGGTSGATATVERTDRFYDAGTQINELIITNIRGTFENGENVSTTYVDTQGSTRTLKANIFGGILNSISITNGGSEYEVGDIVIINSTDGHGSGANAIVSQVSSGNIETLLVTTGGAGFKANDFLLFTGGGGSGANAKVNTVNTDASVHPNSYNIIVDIIAYEANTQIGNAVYSNLVFANANTTLANSFHVFLYGPTGPIDSLTTISLGSGYTSVPTVDALANTRIRELGILGKMNVVNGGLGYAVGDIIEFRSNTGFGANAAVTANAANGMITAVRFTANNGWVIGGVGYDQFNLPTTNVRTTTGSGANIAVVTTLGDGEAFNITTGTLGVIGRITITETGSGYDTDPDIDLTQSGDGTATAIASIITGVFTYPGRYLNDDGHLSSYNFLQDRDYYQNFSYVVLVKKSLDQYVSALKNLGHPAGLKLFGQYIDTFNTLNLSVTANTTTRIIFNTATYTYSNVANQVQVTKTSHGVSNGNNVYLEYTSGDTANITNGYFMAMNVHTNTLNVHHSGGINSSGNVSLGIIQ